MEERERDIDDDDGEESNGSGEGGFTEAPVEAGAEGEARGPAVPSTNRGYLWLFLMTTATLVGRSVLRGEFREFLP
jgi:hypothetical protein